MLTLYVNNLDILNKVILINCACIIYMHINIHSLEPIPYNNSIFGAGNYPIVYSNVRCGGWEDSIIDCKKDTHLDFTCSRNHVVAVLCGDGNIIIVTACIHSPVDCNDGEVHLVGGNGDYEGTVEICFNNLWGLISESGWSTTDAEVICRQLGYGPSGQWTIRCDVSCLVLSYRSHFIWWITIW